MKKFVLFSCSFIFFQCFVFSQDKPTPVISKIKEVTVFLDGAQINRVGSVQLKAGSQQVVFDNLPQSVNAQSIQLSGTGDFTILSVNYQLNYLRQQQKSKEIISLEDSLRSLQNKLRVNAAAKEVIKDEESLLKANQSIGGSQTGVKLEELKAALELYRTRLTELKSKAMRLANEDRTINEQMKNLNDQLTQLRNKTNTPTSEVLVTISANSAVKAQLNISYIVSEAGWAAAYDVRASDLSKPIELIYKAKVHQSSGESWDNVKLTLSSGNPEESGVVPLLSPWFLALKEPQILYKSRMKSGNIRFVAPTIVDSVQEEVSILEDKVVSSAPPPPPPAPKAMEYTEVKMNQTTSEFVIELPYTIPSDGQLNTVEVKSVTLPVTYEYYCAPKIDKDVFLLAKITGWEDLNLLPGESSLYFEGTFVGSAFIDTQDAKDTMNVSLGRDKGIAVTRTRQKDFTSRKFIGSTRTDTRSFEISVKNKKKQTVNLIIEDQIPVSTTKLITIESTKNSGGNLEKASGKITWKVSLQPAEGKTLMNEYQVTYPKDRSVVLE